MENKAKMRYNVVVSDYDGTLAHNDNTVAESTVGLIREFTKQGGSFMVSTGRGPLGIIPPLKKIGITEGKVMCLQGCVVADIATGEYLSCMGMDKNVGYQILKCLEQDIASGQELNIVVYLNGIGHATKITEYIAWYRSVNGSPITEVQGLLSDFVNENDYAVNKVLLVDDPQIIDAYQKKYAGFFQGVSVSKSASELLEFTDAEMNKGVALKNYRAKFLGEEDRVIALGDTQIDAPMLQTADLGVAMGNAMQEAKDVADIVTISNDENGVEYIIRKYCLGEEI